MKNISKFIATVAVFAMTIGSGFAMETDPPAEPVKTTVETEMVEEAPQQMQYMGDVVYQNALGNCVKTDNLLHCTLVDTGTRCTIQIGTNIYFLYKGIQDPITEEWSCGDPLYRIPNPF